MNFLFSQKSQKPNSSHKFLAFFSLYFILKIYNYSFCPFSSAQAALNKSGCCKTSNPVNASILAPLNLFCLLQRVLFSNNEYVMIFSTSPFILCLKQKSVSICKAYERKTYSILPHFISTPWLSYFFLFPVTLIISMRNTAVLSRLRSMAS